MLDKKDIEIIKNVVETAVDERLERRLQPLEKDVKDIKRDVENIKQEVADIKQDVEKTKQDVKNINLFLENVAMPRLNTIEACYTSTYNRYAEGIDQLETMQTDIDILKKTAAKHSEKLQRLA